MKSRFHEAADAELTEAVRYYDAKAPGLGDRFLAEVKAATRRIEQFPEIAPVIEYSVRGKMLHSFPYRIMYVVDPGELFIVAIAHGKRRPGYWADRLPRG
ncbi:MAG TPA: type II toxin-antitoxin system RelE/ParE family toxin [Thermoanaerobaculia bacterium]|nr:type II toxin-antitoxin system RelE/ParE family toxin [Thermoanaerobaculia bacterium]